MKTNTKKNIDIEIVLLISEAFNNFDNSFVLHNESDCYGFFDEYISYNFEKNYFEYYLSSQSAEVNIDGEMIYHTNDNTKIINLSLDLTNYEKLISKVKEIITYTSEKFELEFKEWFMELYEWKTKIDPVQHFINEQTMSIISYVKDLKNKFEGANRHLEYQEKEIFSLSKEIKNKTQDIRFLELRLESKDKKILEYEKLISKYQKQIRDLQSPSLWKRIFKFQKSKI